jgi:hypothetical protein
MPTTQERKRFHRRSWKITKPMSHVYLFSFSKEWDDNRSFVSTSTCQSTARYLSYNYYPKDARSSTVIGVVSPISSFLSGSGAHGPPRRQNMSSSYLCHVPDASAPPRVFFNNPTHARPHDQKSAFASSSGISIAQATRTNLFSKRNPQRPPLCVIPSRMIGTHIVVVHEEPKLDLPDDCDRDTISQLFSSSTLVTLEELQWV